MKTKTQEAAEIINGLVLASGIALIGSMQIGIVIIEAKTRIIITDLAKEEVTITDTHLIKIMVLEKLSRRTEITIDHHTEKEMATGIDLEKEFRGLMIIIHIQ